MRADNRVHTFTYAFTAWEGSFSESDAAKQGWELNVPADVEKGKAEAALSCTVSRDNIILDTVKPAQDGSGDLILRFYDAKKSAGKVSVTIGLPFEKAWICDMLENKREEIPVEKNTMSLDFRAFEIRTIRIS